MKILRYRGKYTDIYFDVSTEQKEQRAYLALFNYLDKVCGYYQYVEGDEIAALEGGRAGKWRDARWLLQIRHGAEHEGWDIEYLVTEEEMANW